MDTRQLAEHLRFYGELGVTGISKDPRWRSRAAALQPSNAADEPAVVQPFRAAGEATVQPFRGANTASTLLTLQEIRTDIGDCTRCKLHTLGRRQIVFGVGNPNADLMFVGEAPGADEDAQGEPFVGRAGQLLTKMIEAMGFARISSSTASSASTASGRNRSGERGRNPASYVRRTRPRPPART